MAEPIRKLWGRRRDVSAWNAALEGHQGTLTKRRREREEANSETPPGVPPANTEFLLRYLLVDRPIQNCEHLSSSAGERRAPQRRRRSTQKCKIQWQHTKFYFISVIITRYRVFILFFLYFPWHFANKTQTKAIDSFRTWRFRYYSNVNINYFHQGSRSTHVLLACEIQRRRN